MNWWLSIVVYLDSLVFVWIYYGLFCGYPKTYLKHFIDITVYFKLITTSIIIKKTLPFYWSSLIAQLAKNPPVMQETPVLYLGGEDLLEKG